MVSAKLWKVTMKMQNQENWAGLKNESSNKNMTPGKKVYCMAKVRQTANAETQFFLYTVIILDHVETFLAWKSLITSELCIFLWFIIRTYLWLKYVQNPKNNAELKNMMYASAMLFFTVKIRNTLRKLTIMPLAPIPTIKAAVCSALGPETPYNVTWRNAT